MLSTVLWTLRPPLCTLCLCSLLVNLASVLSTPVLSTLTGSKLSTLISELFTMTYVWCAALYAATTSSQELISVRNLSSAFVAEIGNGSCVTSYPVTVGDTALSTTIDYTSPTVNCSYDVAAQVL